MDPTKSVLHHLEAGFFTPYFSCTLSLQENSHGGNRKVFPYQIITCLLEVQEVQQHTVMEYFESCENSFQK